MPQLRIKMMVQRNRFYEELEQVFDQFPRYNTKMFLREFNAKVRSEVIFNQ
jgi:hypothetical protein